MGCDIHQYNLIWKDGLYHLEGEGVFGLEHKKYRAEGLDDLDDDSWIYKSDYLIEMVPGRSYINFGVLAGVRSSEFEIEDRQDGYPGELFGVVDEKQFYKMTEDCHSPVWYFLPQLRASLLNAAHECAAYIASWSRFAGNEQPEEYEWLMKSIKRMIDGIDTAKAELGSKEAYRKSIVMFNFDS